MDTAADQLFMACDKDNDGYITRQDLDCLCFELQLEESVEDLMRQFGADREGKISYGQFVRCYQNLQLTPTQETSMSSSSSSQLEGPKGLVKSSESRVAWPGRRERPMDAKNNPVRKGARHWDWLGQAAIDLGLRPKANIIDAEQQQQQPISKEQLLLQRRAQQQRLVPSQPETSTPNDDKEASYKEIAELSGCLSQMTAERDQLKKAHHQRSDPDDCADWETQCQRYEERIVELHSVIAELSRKLETERDDVIPEESECDETRSIVTDSCLEEEEEEDDDEENRQQCDPYDQDSLAFERDLNHHKHEEENESLEEERFDKSVLYKIELFDELQHEVIETRSDNERLRQVIAERDRQLEDSGEAINQLQSDRDSLKRQLDDLQSTLEFQEAKMDKGGRSSAERRSLRRKKSSIIASRNQTINSPTQDTQQTVQTNQQQQQQRTSSSCDDRSSMERTRHLKLEELELDLAKATSQVDHLRSQNDVLALTLEDTKAENEKMSIHLARHESNATAMQLSLAYADQTIEAYDVLVALLETEVACNSEEGSRASCANKRSAMSVARHLLTRLDKNSRADSGIGGLDTNTSWEADSSGYSHTTSSTTSTTSSCHMGELLTTGTDNSYQKPDEARLRDHIGQLKTIRATIQGTVADIEPLHSAASDASRQQQLSSSSQCDIEQAVLRQELMAAREQVADLRAKIYVADKEKSGLELTLQERRAVESMLRTHVHHLQEQLSGQFVGRCNNNSSSSNSSSDVLRQRVENLLDTLDKVIRNSDMRQRQANELIADLKRANSTLSEALEKSKRKYQSKIKRMEQQLATTSLLPPPPPKPSSSSSSCARKLSSVN